MPPLLFHFTDSPALLGFIQRRPHWCPKSTAPAGQLAHASTPSPAQCEIPAAVSLPVYPISMGRSGGVGGPVGATGPLCPSRKLGKTEKHSTRPDQTSKGGGIRLEYEDMPESGDGSGQNRGMAKALTMIVNRKTNDTSLSRHHFSFLSDSAR